MRLCQLQHHDTSQLFSGTPGPRGPAHAFVNARRPISAKDWQWQRSSEHGSEALGVGEHVYVLAGAKGCREWREAQVREEVVKEEAVEQPAPSDAVSSARPLYSVVVDGVRLHHLSTTLAPPCTTRSTPPHGSPLSLALSLPPLGPLAPARVPDSTTRPVLALPGRGLDHGAAPRRQREVLAAAAGGLRVRRVGQ